MKICIIWAGETGHQFAIILFEWIISLLREIERYCPLKNREILISPEIRELSAFLKFFENQLIVTDYGILCYTEENIDSPWITYQAGVVASNHGARIVPIILNINRSWLPEPIRLFQTVEIYERDIENWIIDICNLLGCNKTPVLHYIIYRRYIELENRLKLLLMQVKNCYYYANYKEPKLCQTS